MKKSTEKPTDSPLMYGFGKGDFHQAERSFIGIVKEHTVAKKLSYGELEQRVKELEGEAAKRKEAEKARNEIVKRYQVAAVAAYLYWCR